VDHQEKTPFITPFGVFCYTMMPFGLKNVDATYQHGMQKCLHSQIGRNVEAYVDDVIIKTQDPEDPISNLVETFDNLRKFSMKLNAEKCTFGVPSGKLLGFMVYRRGIESNPEKVSAIANMAPPQCLLDVQKIMGCMDALSRFISRDSKSGGYLSSNS
jgi:hypothetical protein